MQQITQTSSIQPQIQNIVLILADGTRLDLWQHLVDSGDLPNITQIFLGSSKGTIDTAVTTFPSTTGPAHLPFLTGLFPGHCNIPGIRWLDPNTFSKKPLSMFRFRSYMGMGNFFANWDLSPNVRTLFQDIKDHACIGGNVRKGVRFSRNLTRWTKIAHNANSFFTENWYGLDEVAEQKLMTAAKHKTQFVFASFYAADSNGHKFGPTSQKAMASYLHIDKALGNLQQILKQQDRIQHTLIALVSDHGLSDTHTHLDLHALVERFFNPCLSHPKIWHGFFTARSSVMVSGNSMAHIYLCGPKGWDDRLFLDDPPTSMANLVDALMAEEAVDQIIGHSINGGAVVLSKRGNASIKHVSNGIKYETKTQCDPFGYPTNVTGVHTDRELLRLTEKTDYPDAPCQILQLLDSPRCGSLIVTAKPGYDLRSHFEKPKHVGSHGSLHAIHMNVPFLINRQLSCEPKRTVDLYPTILSVLGLQQPSSLDGISLLET